jgi:predicted enzyme related to lactoylglutathione lyase
MVVSLANPPPARAHGGSMNFTGILIGSDNPDRLVEYYTRILGDPGWSEGGYTGWAIGAAYVTVAAHSEVTGPNKEPGRIIWNMEAADVRGEFERFKAAGATVVAEPYTMEGDDSGGAIATFADPDGNYFQLMSPMPPPSNG